MARLSLLNRGLFGAIATGIALGTALPAMAQDAPAPAKQASVRLDFGMGRKVHIDCGDLALAACLDAAKPAIDKVAETPLPAMIHPQMGRPGKDRLHGGKERIGWGGKDRGPVPENNAPAEAQPATPPAN